MAVHCAPIVTRPTTMQMYPTASQCNQFIMKSVVVAINFLGKQQFGTISFIGTFVW